MTNYLTNTGLEELQLELKNIIEVRLSETLESINRALAEGDVSENSALDAAKIERDKLVARQQEVEEILSDYQIIDEQNLSQSKLVQIGSSVKINYLRDNSSHIIKIVGSSESDALNNKISNESPLAQAIIGKKPGQECSFKSKSGVVKIKIIEIL